VAAVVFADPAGQSAEQLLSAADCAGMSVGGVRVAEGALNSLRTTRVTSAADVAELCRRMQQRVHERHGIRLTPVLQFVDEQGMEYQP
jgi:UDP-N-acetylenolpyruvoylglucosamine reductase